MIDRKLPDAEYFHARAIEEQVAAQRATCAVARKRHEELAVMYRFRASQLKTYEPRVEASQDAAVPSPGLEPESA